MQTHKFLESKINRDAKEWRELCILSKRLCFLVKDDGSVLTST